MSLPSHPLKRMVKLNLGRLLAGVMPARSAALRAGAISGEYTRIDRWMLAAFAHEAQSKGRPEALHAAHQKFWTTQSAAAVMLELGDDRLIELLEIRTQGLFAPLGQAMRQAGCRSLIEVGCGTGQVLEFFARRFPELDELHGIDLNPGLIAACRRRTDPRLHFHLGDAITLIGSLARPSQGLLSYGGVLEYFLESQVKEIYGWLREHCHPVVVALVEPVGHGHDLDRQPDSQLYGVERSYSHNYPALLGASGYELLYRDEVLAGDMRFLMLVARSRPV